MSRRGSPYVNAQAESFIKTLKVVDAYLMECETLYDVAIGLPQFIEAYNNRTVKMSTHRGALHLPQRLSSKSPSDFH